MRGLIFAVLLVGCDAERAGRGGNSSTITVEVGTGVNEYLPLEEYEVLQMTHGPQGAWHLDVAGRVTHAPDVVGLLTTVSLVHDDRPLASPPAMGFVLLADYSDRDASGFFAGQRAVIGDIAEVGQHEVCDLHGRLAEICTEVVDPETEETGVGCATIEIALDPIDIEHNCTRFERL